MMKGLVLNRTVCPNFEDVRPKQVALVARGNTSASIRDFGGLYIVHGRYALDAAIAMRSTLLSMIDLNPVPEFWVAVEAARRLLPYLEVEFVHADFRLPQLYDVIKPVDTSLLFNVLMHQENYLSIIGGACRTTNRYICVAQPCMKETEFSLPASATLLQFWDDKIKDAYREGAFWPPEGPIERFDAARWMWGHTVSHLVACFQGFGWTLDSGEVIEQALGPHWDYPLLRFRPKT